jgi:hypothetical protein
MGRLASIALASSLLCIIAGCGGSDGSAGQPSFPYTQIAGVPNAVNDLGRLIGQQQRNVVTPGGDQFNPGFSAVDQQRFDGSNQLSQIVSSVTATQTFAAGVASIRTLPAATQQIVFTAYSKPIYATWAMNGHIGDDGTTDAGYAVEQEIATALTNAVESAVDSAPTPAPTAGPPTVTLDPPAAGASELSGHAYNIDTTKIKVVIYVLTNEWYVQPLVDAPFTDISSDGSWSSYTNPWDSIVVLLVNPANYTPAATEIANPALDPGVLAWTEYPSSGPVSLNFSGRSWGIKVSGDPFDPGPNLWSNDSSVVNVAADGLHLKITMVDGHWQCGEVYLLESLGYGTYTVQINSQLNQLDRNTVAAPLFIYAAPGQELDNEYSGAGGLIPSPNNAQFVVQPYSVSGNIVQYVQPSTSQFTSQIEWRADHVTFRAWNGWSNVPAAGDVIQEWTYTGAYIPSPGRERVHINVWLLNGSAPLRGIGDEMVISSFTFQP